MIPARRISGNSFLDYAITLTIVGMALSGMMLCIKRGAQGAAKRCTDTFIGDQSTHISAPSGAGQSSSSMTSTSEKKMKMAPQGDTIIQKFIENSSGSYSGNSAMPANPDRSYPDEYFNAWHDPGIES